VLRTLFYTFHRIDEKCFQKQMLTSKWAPLMAEESGSRTRQETPNAPSPVLKTGAATGRHSPPFIKMAQCTGGIKLSLTARENCFSWFSSTTFSELC
jgi:hypothetical protein